MSDETQLFIDFVNNEAVIKVNDQESFEKFKDFLKRHGLKEEMRKFDSWLKLVKLGFINNKNDDHLFLFEYTNGKGLTWSDDEEHAISWYGRDPVVLP